MDIQSLGAFIRSRRKDLGMTQSELGAKLHVTDKAVSRWERGVGFPDIKLLEPLAEALDLSVEELIQCQRIELGQKDVAGQTKKLPWLYRYRRVWAVLCFLIYLLLRVMKENPLLSSQMFWMSPMSKLLFAITAIAFLFASYREVVDGKI